MVADTAADMAADMEMHNMVADKVAEMVADVKKKKGYPIWVGNGGWLIGPKLFRPKA